MYALTRRKSGQGFTVVELLVVIAIIGVLAGFGVPALMRAYLRARVFTVQQTISELETAVEAFKTKHGFYPPDFTRIQNASQFLNFLNRYSPNHAEGQLAPHPGYPATTRRVDIWWDQVGQYLGPDSALTFWLSGIGANKQYPLTYIAADGNITAIPPYNVQISGTTIEREGLFEFKNAGLIPVFEQSGVPGDQRGFGGGIPPAPLFYPDWDNGMQAGFVCAYAQFTDGAKDPFLYFELKSFRYNVLDPAAQSSPPLDIFPHRNLQIGGAAGVVVPHGYVQRNTRTGLDEYYFYRGDSFQIMSAGVDSTYYQATRTPVANKYNPTAAERRLLLDYSNIFDQNVILLDPNPMDVLERDNLSNFYSGPLEGVQLPN